MTAKTAKDKKILINYPVNSLLKRDLRQGVLSFGMDGFMLEKFKEIFGNELCHWPHDKKIRDVSEFSGLTLVVTNFFGHSYREDVLKLFEDRRALDINMIVCVPKVPDVIPGRNPIISSEELSNFIQALSNNSQATFFSACEKPLASFLASIYGHDAFRFETIMITAFAQLHRWDGKDGYGAQIN